MVPWNRFVTTTPVSPAPRQIRSERPGLAIVVVMIGVLITAVVTTIVVLALPEIERGLHVALDSVIWVVIGYLLVITLLATQVGRLGDMFGRVRMYEAGFVVFIVGSALCALAWDEASIVVFRVLQGVGGAFVTANSGAVIADLFPREQRGKAYGYNGIGFSLGAVLGILLGGAIVTYVSWRWIFWINVPIGLAGVGLAVLFLAIMYLQGPRQLSPLHAAVLLISGYLVGDAAGPVAGRLTDRFTPVLPATVGLAIQVVALFIYAHLTLTTGSWLVVVASVVNGIGGRSFFPANNSAVMKASPPESFGISSGMLRTFANVGMVFSFSMAMLNASRST